MADLDSRAVGNLAQNSQNAEQTNVIRNSNRFPLDYSFPTTHRYGDIDLFYYYFGERGDRVPLRTGHSVRTFTMKSPNEIDIYMRKHFVHVPMKAIYPRTWDEVLYPLPVDGDVAPVDGRANFPILKYINSLISKIRSASDTPSDTSLAPRQFGILMRLFDSLSDVVSNGSLFSAFNIHLSDTVSAYYTPNEAFYSLDRALSLFYTEIAARMEGNVFSLEYINDNDATALVRIGFNVTSAAEVDYNVTTWHQFHELIVRYGYCFTDKASLFASFFGEFVPALSPTFVSSTEMINIEPILAYQMSCAQFYTNDRVDDIFSANTYRNYVQELYLTNYDLDPFGFNGVSYIYDTFSQHYFSIIIDGFSSIPFDDSSLFDHLNYFDALFKHRRSLRYGDYFLGARTRPLAVGESSIPVTGDGVMVEDITKSAALQRLRYNINVIGRKINNQLQQLIPGKAPRTPDDIPLHIASQDFNIGKDSQSVANTASNQLEDPNSITQYLNHGSSDFAFQIDITEPCIILGLVSFAVPRVYSKTVDRFAFHLDRYDMFIPQMQFIGDQEIYRKEFFGLSAQDGNDPFAYNQQYSEYKQRYPYAAGGFIEFLPSWEMITDNKDSLHAPWERKLSSKLVHSIPCEFDRFYLSLSGNSLADYFHFIVKHYNTSTPERAMAWNPQPLL